jgi:hypothetical protein
MIGVAKRMWALGPKFSDRLCSLPTLQPSLKPDLNIILFLLIYLVLASIKHTVAGQIQVQILVCFTITFRNVNPKASTVSGEQIYRLKSQEYVSRLQI